MAKFQDVLVKFLRCVGPSSSLLGFREWREESDLKGYTSGFKPSGRKTVGKHWLLADAGISLMIALSCP